MNLKSTLYLLFFTWFSFLTAQDCPNPPTIEFLMVDACGPPEAPNEFAIINSAEGFLVDDFQFTFNPTNTGFGSNNSNVNIGFDSSCGLTTGNADVYVGCDNVIELGLGDEVPPNSYVIFQTSNNADAIYDISNLCVEDECIYVIANSCARTQGAFTNKQTATPGPRQNFVSIAGTNCFHEATYNTEDLISNANGNYFIPPDTYGITPGDPCQVPALPTLEQPLPNFDLPTEICSIEAEEFELPTLSEEAVEGTWSPAFDPNNSQTYIFTPNEGECFDQISREIIIIPAETPIFSLSSTLCEDESFELPSVSDNGIEGEWNPPEVDNSVNSYEFTPAEDECAEIIQIEFEFIPIEEPDFDLPDSICEGDELDFPLISTNDIPGEWSPEFDNQNSGTYVFTPENECFPEFSIDIEVQDIVVFDFDLNEEICENFSNDFEFPISSNNGFSGSWSPDFDSDNSNTYTFIPDDVDCFEEFSIFIDIISAETPIFNLPEEVCEGEDLELPTVSENGIQGTWNTDFDNSTTTTYIFTPSEEECANEFSLTIEVIENIVPVFNLPEEVCENEDFQLPTLSENNIEGTWNPIVGEAEDDIYIFTPADGECALNLSVEIQFILVDTPEFDLPDQICAGELIELPTTSNNGIVGTWEPSFNPDETTTYTFTPSTETCEIETFEQTIEVIDIEVDLSTDLIETCSISSNPFLGEFDLQDVADQINFQNQNLEISFHNTLEDAETNQNSLELNYLSSSNESIWVRIAVPDSNCLLIENIDLVTFLTPDTQPATDLEKCAISQDDVQQFFDLTQVEAEVLAGIENPELLEIDYFLDEESAINETPEGLIDNPSNYLSNTNNQNLEEIVFIRVTNPESNLNCFSIQPIKLRVNTLPIITPPTLLAVCKDDMSGTEGQFATFDLTSKNNEITNNTPSYQVEYFETEEDLNTNNPIEDPANYTNTENPQNLLVRVSTQSTLCDATTNLTLVVSPNPTIPSPEPLIECAGDNNGFALFDLATEIDAILANEVETEISFHETEADAQNNVNPIIIEDGEGNSILYENQNSNQQTLYIRASAIGNSNQLNTNCFVIRPIELIVESLPEIQNLEDLSSCDDDSANGFTNFDLSLNNQEILGNQNQEDFLITYHLNASNAQAGVGQIAVPQNFTNSTNPQEIFVRIESTETGCSRFSSFFIEVNERPAIVLTASNEFICADPSEAQAQNNNFGTFDLTTKDEEINPNFDNSSTQVRYYDSEESLVNGDFIATPTEFQNTANPQLIFAEVIDLENGCVSITQVQFEINVHPLPVVDIGNMNGASLCVDPISGELIDPNQIPILDTGLDENDYEFSWSLDGETIEGETNSFLVAFLPGRYEVEVTDVSFSTLTQCFSSSEAEIIESSAPLFEVNVLSTAFQGEHEIEIINITGLGDYEFSVDGGPWIELANQQSLIFNGLGFGEIEIIGRDKNGCGESHERVTLIDYPKFFTPNNDGFNDTWNIIGLANQGNARILIFDRYGKLLKQLSPSSEGWDGTYNGKPMPSNDYWFQVEYKDLRTGSRKTFKANFTLKR